MPLSLHRLSSPSRNWATVRDTRTSMLCAVQPCSLVEPSVRDADAGQGSRRGEGRRGGWEVQLVEGGSAGAGEEVCVRRGLWKQHRPIIMGSMGESLLSIEPAALADALDRAGRCAGRRVGCSSGGWRWVCRRWLQWLQGLCSTCTCKPWL